ncbi:methionyl-tRNA formyltransferase [Cellulomonas bogoriensis]
MRLIFAGTPEVALPSLEALVASEHEVVAVLTRPDAPSGRGRRPRPSPVKERAVALGLPVLEPASLRTPEAVTLVQDLRPDCVPVVAYGALVPRDLLDVPTHGWVNLHFSVLPAWRGAAPVQHALMAGDEVTGATTFRIDEGLDTGPVLGSLTETVRARDTAGDLLQRLAVAGADLLTATVDGLADDRLVPVPQPADGVSHAPRLSTDDARVRWEHPAVAVDRRVRGCTPAPGAWTLLPDGTRLRLGPVRPAGVVRDLDQQEVSGLAPGEVRPTRRHVLVGTATEPVVLSTVAPAGRREMDAADWARGARLQAGDHLGAA